jgi:hypothetical protein
MGETIDLALLTVSPAASSQAPKKYRSAVSRATIHCWERRHSKGSVSCSIHFGGSFVR